MKQKKEILKPKDSELEILTWKYLKILFFMNFLLCLFASSFHVLYLLISKDSLKTWVEYSFISLGQHFLIVFCSWFLILV